MARIIQHESGSSLRNRICKEIVLTIRSLMVQPQPDESSKDMVAFIILSLEKIQDITDQTVSAWEKKDYWVKADKYKLEWVWVEDYSNQLLGALNQDQWTEIALLIAQIGQKLKNISVSPKNRLGTPWIGAFKYIKQ